VAACLALGLALVLGLDARPAQAQDAATLQARQASLREALTSSPFQRPLVLESQQDANDLRGDVYAVVEQPFSVVSSALQGSAHWCELLMLHLNVKGCTASGTPPNEQVDLAVGRKFDQPLADTYALSFHFTMPALAADYLRMEMTAANGPMGTRDYRLMLEAVALDATHSFLHMTYAYSFGLAARLAMQGYLATIGSGKVGFSIVGHGSEGRPVYIDGVRGVIERNTMRYFLAIDVYLGSTTVPAAQRLDRQLTDWFAAVERYPVQLHELERAQYLDMKHREFERLRSTAK